jgi:hypothetical protein
MSDSRYEEIRGLLSASKRLLGKDRVSESNEILSNYLLTEQDSSDLRQRINPLKSIKKSFKKEKGDEDTEDKKGDKQQSYRISGGILTMHGTDRSQLELTTDEKIAFQETMDEFIEDVSSLVNFDALHIYQNDVEWGGKIIDFDLDFYFTIGENNGIYINGDMIKIDEEFLGMINDLQSYYEKFKAKWSKVTAARKRTSPKNMGV